MLIKYKLTWIAELVELLLGESDSLPDGVFAKYGKYELISTNGFGRQSRFLFSKYFLYTSERCSPCATFTNRDWSSQYWKF